MKGWNQPTQSSHIKGIVLGILNKRLNLLSALTESQLTGIKIKIKSSSFSQDSHHIKTFVSLF